MKLLLIFILIFCENYEIWEQKYQEEERYYILYKNLLNCKIEDIKFYHVDIIGFNLVS